MTVVKYITLLAPYQFGAINHHSIKHVTIAMLDFINVLERTHLNSVHTCTLLVTAVVHVMH